MLLLFAKRPRCRFSSRPKRKYVWVFIVWWAYVYMHMYEYVYIAAKSDIFIDVVETLRRKHDDDGRYSEKNLAYAIFYNTAYESTYLYELKDQRHNTVIHA